MSEYSTIKITQRAAQRYLLNKVMEATDHELETMMDSFLAESLYNCSVIPNDTEENDDERL